MDKVRANTNAADSLFDKVADELISFWRVVAVQIDCESYEVGRFWGSACFVVVIGTAECAIDSDRPKRVANLLQDFHEGEADAFGSAPAIELATTKVLS